MPKKTINAIWAKDTNNKLTLNDDEVKLGIKYKGSIVSNELNGLGNSIYQYLDAIQRAFTAYNPLKKYSIGDTGILWVNYNGVDTFLTICFNKDGQIVPLIQKDFATEFIADLENSAVKYTIKDDGTHELKEYLSSDCIILKDYSYIELKNELKTLNAKLENKITADNKKIETNSLVVNENGTIKTPTLSASGKEIINAEWFSANSKANNNKNYTTILLYDERLPLTGNIEQTLIINIDKNTFDLSKSGLLFFSVVAGNREHSQNSDSIFLPLNFRDTISELPFELLAGYYNVIGNRLFTIYTIVKIVRIKTNDNSIIVRHITKNNAIQPHYNFLKIYGAYN